MNKALEDLQAGRDPFATREEEKSGGDFFHPAALWSMWLSIAAGGLCYWASDMPKNMNLSAQATHIWGMAWIIGSCVLFGASIILGIIALCGMGRYGIEGILTRALRGIVISGIMISLLATGVIRGIENRKALQSLQASVDQMQQDIKKDIDQRHGMSMSNYQQDAQNIKNALDTASVKLSGNDALIAKAASGLMTQMQAQMKAYAVAAAPLQDPAFFSMNGVTQPLQLQARKEVVAKFTAANERLLVFVNDCEKNFTAEMNSLGVPAAAQAEALRGFTQSLRGQDNLLPKIRLKDRDVGTALMGMFNLLDSNWGRWKYNPETRKVDFADPATLDKYNSLLKDMVTAGQEQGELQKQYFAAQTKGG